MTRTRDVARPARSASGRRQLSSGSGSPAARPRPARTRARFRPPPGRGSRRRCRARGRAGARDRPATSRSTHRPLTKPTRPSTAIVLRWSRVEPAERAVERGGLNARTSRPPRAAVPERREAPSRPASRRRRARDARAGALARAPRRTRARPRRRRRCSSRTGSSARAARSRRATPDSSRRRRAAGGRHCRRSGARRPPAERAVDQHRRVGRGGGHGRCGENNRRTGLRRRRSKLPATRRCAPGVSGPAIPASRAPRLRRALSSPGIARRQSGDVAPSRLNTSARSAQRLSVRLAVPAPAPRPILAPKRTDWPTATSECAPGWRRGCPTLAAGT